jgi:hypothetical protein
MTARTTDETDASPAPGPNASRHPHHEQSTTRSNNQAERTIRPVKFQQRGSGGAWRTLDATCSTAKLGNHPELNPPEL